MYGVDICDITNKHLYQDTQTTNLDEEEIKWSLSTFDIVFASHVLEHLTNGNKLVESFASLMKGGGKLYIEVPSIYSLNLPQRSEFILNGFPEISPTNFYDDGTHKHCYSIDKLREICNDAGLSIIESGYIENLYLAEEMIAYGYHKADAEIATYGLWLKFRWCQYVICEKGT